MDVPSPVTVHDGAFATDGGSISLSLAGPDGQRHALLLTQHRLPRFDSDGPLRGRLYFDRELVRVRSVAEARLREALRAARFPDEKPAPSESASGGPTLVVGADIQAYLDKVQEGPASALRHLVESVLDYVDSDEYVTFARRR